MHVRRRMKTNVRKETPILTKTKPVVSRARGRVANEFFHVAFSFALSNDGSTHEDAMEDEETSEESDNLALSDDVIAILI
jgi:hypothetical protein